MSEVYDYRQAVYDDVMQYIDDHNINYTDYSTLSQLEEKLYDEMFIDDSVTGNASGSYTFNAWRAEEYLCHNKELLDDAASEFGDDVYTDSPEVQDVVIRIYLLPEAIHRAMDDISDDFDAAQEEAEV